VCCAAISGSLAKGATNCRRVKQTIAALAYEHRNFGSARIFVMNADGTDQHQLTLGPFNDIGPAWSPDGTEIAFVHDVGLLDRSVVVMNADGSDVHAVHPAGRQLVPAWQPLGAGDTNEP